MYCEKFAAENAQPLMLSGDSISVHTEIGSKNRVDFPPKGVLVTGLIAFAATLITYCSGGEVSRSDVTQTPDQPSSSS
jgi:hypothetical protein